MGQTEQSIDELSEGLVKGSQCKGECRDASVPEGQTVLKQNK